MLIALVRGVTLISGGSLLAIACSGLAAESTPAPDAGVTMLDEDPPPSMTQPPPRDAGAPPSPQPPSCDRDRPARLFCSSSPACEYQRIAEDRYIQRFLDPCGSLPPPPSEPDGGLDADAAAPADPACETRSVADFSCTCTDSSSGAAYTLVHFDGAYTTLSLYFATGDAGPGELVAAVETTDVCDQCGCATYYGEAPDCACADDADSGAN